MDMPDTNRRPPLWKQMLSAVIGAVIALVLYEGYVVTRPVLEALLIAPQSQIAAEHIGEARVSNVDVSTMKLDRIAARSQEIYRHLSAPVKPKPQNTRTAIIVPSVPPSAPSSAQAAFASVGSSSQRSQWGSQQSSAGERILESPMPPPQLPEEPVRHVEAAQLPSSGIGTWIAGISALFGAMVFAMHRRRGQSLS